MLNRMLWLFIWVHGWAHHKFCACFSPNPLQLSTPMPSAPKLYILAELLERVGCPRSAALPWWLPHHDTPQCHHNPQLRIEVCQMLGVPLPIEKVELPTTALKFPRMLLDITNMGVHLPVDKHHPLLGQQKHSYKQEILSFVSLLQHAAKVVHLGHTYAPCMYSLNCTSEQRVPLWPIVVALILAAGIGLAFWN